MIDEKMKKTLKILNFLCLVPFMGYLIVLFYGAFRIDKAYKGKLPVFTFMIFSVIFLALFSVPVMLIMYYFILGKVEPIGLQIFLSLLLIYVAFLCVALATFGLLKSKLSKL